MRDVRAVVARSTCRSQNLRTAYVRTTFGGCDVEKVHAAMARSVFASQRVLKNWRPGPFFEVRMRFGNGFCTSPKVRKTCLKHPVRKVEISFRRLTDKIINGVNADSPFLLLLQTP